VTPSHASAHHLGIEPVLNGFLYAGLSLIRSNHAEKLGRLSHIHASNIVGKWVYTLPAGITRQQLQGQIPAIQEDC